MLIGLDFDNTLVSYDEVFLTLAKNNGVIPKEWSGNKIKLREYLRSQKGGEYQWQKLQGKIYGKWMHRAVLFDGVVDFLIGCKDNNISLCIVSHKTKYGIHDDEKIPLREEALRWMEAQGFFSKLGIKKNNIFFEPTKEDKIKKIRSLNCDYFIDDLKEILEHPDFPSNTRKILFSNSKEKIIIDAKIINKWNDLSVESFIC